MLTLSDVKDELRIDFNDQDAYLSRLLEGEINKAETITGIEAIDFNTDIENAVMKGVKSMYLNRTDTSVDLSTSTIIYRRYSIKPAF